MRKPKITPPDRPIAAPARIDPPIYQRRPDDDAISDRDPPLLKANYTPDPPPKSRRVADLLAQVDDLKADLDAQRAYFEREIRNMDDQAARLIVGLQQAVAALTDRVAALEARGVNWSKLLPRRRR